MLHPEKWSKLENGFPGLDQRQMIDVGEKGFIMLGSERYFTDHNEMGRTYSMYHEGDVIVSLISPAGKSIWNRKLPKNQEAFGRFDRGFSVLRENDGFFVIHEGNKENLGLSQNKAPKIADKDLMAYKVSYDGKVDHSYVTDLKKVDGMNVYDFSYDCILPIHHEGKFYMELYKKDKEDILVEVKLK